MQHMFLFSKALIAVAVFGVAIGTSPLLQAAPEGWKLTWSDEFDGEALDTTKWDALHWKKPFNNERQAYLPSRATVSDGHLVITADDLPSEGQPYTSARVESHFAQRHGRWEIRAKLPGTKGTWPAIWLLPDVAKYPWPSQGEIDILENRGDQPDIISCAYHFGANPGEHEYLSHHQKSMKGGQLENYHDEFHVYAVEWDEHTMRFFVDDVHFHTMSNQATKSFLGGQTAPAQVVLNVAVGGDFLDDQQPDESSVWPQTMLVDYVRVYQRAEESSPAEISNGSFEQQSGSLAHWSTFGNAVPNVHAYHAVSANEGEHALKVFGQFSGATNYSGVSQGIKVEPGQKVSASASVLVRSDDDIVGDNRVEMRIDYYRVFGGQYGGPNFLASSRGVVVADAVTANDVWHESSLVDQAPADSQEARVVFTFIQPKDDPGAVHIDSVKFKVSSGQESRVALNAEDGDELVDIQDSSK